MPPLDILPLNSYAQAQSIFSLDTVFFSLNSGAQVHQEAGAELRKHKTAFPFAESTDYRPYQVTYYCKSTR